MDAYDAVIYRIGVEVDTAIRTVIDECLQWRDFPMIYPQDDRGNTTFDLYRYWLGRRLEESRVLFFRPRGITPPCLELELSITNALADYEQDIFHAVQVPPHFGSKAAEAGFDVEIIGPGNIVITICGTRVANRYDVPKRRPRQLR